ncbi:MAG: hypothetical protein WA971_05950, partial [Microbacterium sp.]
MTTLHSHRTDLVIELDDASGLPVRIGDATARFRLRLETGGEERRGAYGGLRIDAPQVHDTSRLRDVSRPDPHSADDVATVVTVVGDHVVEWTYTFRDTAPRLSIGVAVRNTGAGELLLRDLTMEIDLLAPEDATVHAPGNRIRPGLRLAELTSAVPVNTAGGTPGSTGLVALSTDASSLVVWPFSRDAVGATAVERIPDGLR